MDEFMKGFYGVFIGFFQLKSFDMESAGAAVAAVILCLCTVAVVIGMVALSGKIASELGRRRRWKK